MPARYRPGRDRRAVLHRASPGASHLREQRHVAVVGGGIAGLAAAVGLAERGVRVTLLERQVQLGGRVRAWPTGDGRTMSRGFHAFFRQYYNLRALLRRSDPALTSLIPIDDYPLQRADGLRDSFAGIPRTPPVSVIGFVLRSPTFPLAALRKVDLPAALELVTADFPASFARYDGESAQAFLDRLRFPHGARHLALEVFARSFFAHPEDFSAGELVAMFHAYFTGSSEGLLFDVPDDDYDTALWAPLGRYLTGLGVDIRTGVTVTGLAVRGDGVRVELGSEEINADGLVMAADPRAARHLLADLTGPDDTAAGAIGEWVNRLGRHDNAPPFAVNRLWLDRPVDPSRLAFLGTSGYNLLDNVSVLERFEAGARRWSRDHGGSVVELHAYALDPARNPAVAAQGYLREQLRAELSAVYPETADASVLREELLVEDDCPLVGTSPWRLRPPVDTPLERVTMAGDWVRCDWPVALMERAATTGFLAANQLLERWGVAGQDLWTVPTQGIAARRRFAAGARAPRVARRRSA
ncbi:MAG TPA: FAD-dependent oxidoreductase [Dermatophilaceae bacterium]|nr:FAD-dependent oxidoreductase [Dermatophilaceae bacterium]